MTSNANQKPDLKLAPLDAPGASGTAAPSARDPASGLREENGPGSSRTHSFSVRMVRGLLQVALPALIIAGAFAAYNYFEATRPVAPQRLAQPTVYPVRAKTVDFATVQPELELFGTTVAGRQVDIRALVAGQVISTGENLRDGGEIEKGEPILTIDPFDYRSQLAEINAQIAEAKAKINELQASIAVERDNVRFAREQAKLAESDLQRAEPLSRRGAVSERTVDDRRVIVNTRRQAVALGENNIKVWEARIAQQRAMIERLEAGRDRAAQRLDETKLTSPFNAYVTDVAAQVGRIVGVNDKVATLIDRDRIEVAFNVTNNQFGRLSRGNGGIVGRNVDIRWQVGDEPLIFQGTIERIGAQVSSEAGGVKLYATVKEPAKGVALRPGTFVEVRVPDTKFSDVARLPSTAVFNGNTVFAIVDGKLDRRNVKIIGTAGSDVLVRGDLKSGEAVMTTRLSLPGDGVSVRPVGDEAKSGAAAKADVEKRAAAAAGTLPSSAGGRRNVR